MATWPYLVNGVVQVWPFWDNDISQHPRLFVASGYGVENSQPTGPGGGTIDPTWPHGHIWSLALSKYDQVVILR